MAASKTYDIDGAVFVAYPFPSDLAFSPQARTVKEINFSGTGNDANVTFDEGNPVQDTDALQTVFLLQKDAAAAIVTDVIAKSAAAVVLDTDNLSEASTVGQASSTLGRVD